MAKALNCFCSKRFLPDEVQDLGKIASDERIDTLEHCLRTFVNGQQTKFGIDEIDAERCSVHQSGEHLLISAQGFLRSIAVDAKSKLVGNGQAEIELRLVEYVRRTVIDHEFTDQLFIDHQRNECQRADAFFLDDRSKPFIQVCRTNIVDADRLRISDIW